VPYLLLSERIPPSSPLAENERGTLTIHNQQPSLPPDVTRSTLSVLSSNPPSGVDLLQSSDAVRGLTEETRLSGTSPLSIEKAPLSLLRQSRQGDLPPEPRRLVESLDSNVLGDSSASASQPTLGPVEQPILSLGAEDSPVSELTEPLEARRSVASIPLIDQSQDVQHALELLLPVTQGL
jgi:hypothetical protein